MLNRKRNRVGMILSQITVGGPHCATAFETDGTYVRLLRASSLLRPFARRRLALNAYRDNRPVRQADSNHRSVRDRNWLFRQFGTGTGRLTKGPYQEPLQSRVRRADRSYCNLRHLSYLSIWFRPSRRAPPARQLRPPDDSCKEYDSVSSVTSIVNCSASSIE